MRGPSLDVRIWLLKTLTAFKGLSALSVSMPAQSRQRYQYCIPLIINHDWWAYADNRYFTLSATYNVLAYITANTRHYFTKFWIVYIEKFVWKRLITDFPLPSSARCIIQCVSFRYKYFTNQIWYWSHGQNGVVCSKQVTWSFLDVMMPDNIYLISESYISYTRLFLFIQDGCHNSKWPPVEQKFNIILNIIFKRS